MAIASFLFNNLGKVTLNHIGVVNEIGAPSGGAGQYTIITNQNELQLIATQDAGKKADIYVNGIGVSLKQAGSNFAYNRLQRSEMLDVFTTLGFEDPDSKLATIDNEVNGFHTGTIKGRSRPWNNFFSENDFKILVRFLMMEGSPNLGFSNHPANLILLAPSSNISQANIEVYTFDEYFEWFKQNLFFAIRRQWIGQSSGEHTRALGFANKPGNMKWIYDDIKGSPRVSKTTKLKWRLEYEEKDRKTVYMIFIEKK